MIALYLLLMLVSLGLWIWLTERIWRASPLAAAASFFFLFPAVYWCYRLWNDPDAHIRVPAIANVVVTLLVLTMSYKIGSAEMDKFVYDEDVAAEKHPELVQRSDGGEMADWCREKHNGSYDRDLGTCVETPRNDPAAVKARAASFERLASYFKQNGIDGEFESTLSKADDDLLAQPEIAGVAGYNFFPLSMHQAPIKLLICSSAAACADYQRNSAPTMLRNADLLLQLPATSDDPRMRELQTVFQRYRPA